MSREFKLPDLGEGIHEAEIISVLVKEGDTVKEDQPIFEVETDKAMVEIPSPVAGAVEKIFVKVGQVARVGMVMVTFGEATGAREPAANKAAAGAQQAVPAAQGIAGAPKPQGAIAAHHVPHESKATAHLASQHIMPSHHGAGHDGKQGQAAVHEGIVPATPATRRLARELGVDLNSIAGSGPGGRVFRQDVEAFAAGGGSSAYAQAKPPSPFAVRHAREIALDEPLTAEPLIVPPAELPDFEKYGPIERIPLRSVRRKIAINIGPIMVPYSTRYTL